MAHLPCKQRISFSNSLQMKSGGSPHRRLWWRGYLYHCRFSRLSIDAAAYRLSYFPANETLLSNSNHHVNPLLSPKPYM
ncbi:hypothetical protein MIMGU_mgv1a017381mg [Erythranthe guttata]|uniref:Uncharacterized protein n=1 Tax=Erythranthe guttata TaxID=4155 RepID=A0A022QFH3_ERYGU|nr:hypothetical protein MIMGU_mgv1a017381mg [Erythranthe guttata]